MRTGFFTILKKAEDGITQLFRKISIAKRLIIYFMLLLVVQMVIIGSFSYGWISNYLEKMALNNMSGIDNYVSLQVNSIKSSYEELSDRILSNTTIQNLLVKNIGAKPTGQIYSDQLTVSDALYDPTDTSYAVIAQSNGIVYQPASGNHFGATFSQLKISTAYRRSFESSGNNIWFSLNENMLTGKKEPFLYECRTVKSLEPRTRVIGQLIIEIPIIKLGSAFSKTKIEDGEYFEIFDAEGYCLYSTKNPNALETKASDPFLALLNKYGDGYQTIRNGRDELLVSYTLRNDNGWSLLHVLPMKVITAKASLIRNDILLIMAISLLALLPLLILLSRSISNPVKRLKSIVDEFGSGNLSVREKESRMDEIGHLQASFNQMAADINDLLDRITKEHKQRRLLELSILEYQINPHFLYNSLDSINWLSRASANREAEELIYALAAFLRVGLSKGKEFYTVKDELEHVRQYLLINKIRFKNCFQFEIQAGEDVLDLLTIRIILQPLAENAIKYGVNKKSSSGFIHISARKEEDSVLLEVADNGPGIPNGRLKAIQNILTDHTQLDVEQESGFGLFNVNQRIWLQYGEGYGINIISGEGSGTTVQIRIPIADSRMNTGSITG